MDSPHTHGSRPGGHAHTASPLRHYRREVKVSTFPVTLRCRAFDATAVSVVGSFDDGKPHPMHRAIDGYWQVTLQLKRGRYEYRFLLDGVPTLDPKSFGAASQPDGSKSSLLEVGY